MGLQLMTMMMMMIEIMTMTMMFKIMIIKYDNIIILFSLPDHTKHTTSSVVTVMRSGLKRYSMAG